MAEEMITIPKWKFETIENALRLTNNIYHVHKKITAYDREAYQAYGYAQEALAKPKNEATKALPLHSVVFSEERAELSCNTCKYVEPEHDRYCDSCYSFLKYEKAT